MLQTDHDEMKLRSRILFWFRLGSTYIYIWWFMYVIFRTLFNTKKGSNLCFNIFSGGDPCDLDVIRPQLVNLHLSLKSIALKLCVIFSSNFIKLEKMREDRSRN